MALARDMGLSGKLPSGRDIRSPPRFFIGCADSAADPAPEWRPTSLEAKIAAGAKFAQMQFCFDMALTKRYFARLAQFGITSRLKMIAGVGPLANARQARHMRDNLFGIAIPDAVIARLEDATDPKREGQAICAEIIAELRRVPGVAGVHIMAPMQTADAIAEAIRLAGLR
jgi:methylenetetrahydrofolate reductase (NADPH)